MNTWKNKVKYQAERNLGHNFENIYYKLIKFKVISIEEYANFSVNVIVN